MAGPDAMDDEAEVRSRAAAALGDYIPDGYETLDAFLEEMRERRNTAADADSANREMGLEDLKFLKGDQWDEKVKAQRIRKRLPVMTINTLPQHVGQVVGDIRINKPAIKVRPAEGGDKRVAEVRQGIIRFVENQSNAPMVYALAGEDQVGGGIGHFRIGLEYATNDTFDQDIRIRHIPDPFAVLWDPMSTDPTGADARYCFVIDEMDRKVFKETYPNAKAAGADFDLATSSCWSIDRDTVQVGEYWVMKTKLRTLAVMRRPGATQDSIEDITGKESDADVAPFITTGADGRPRVRQAPRFYACMYLTNGEELLERPYEIPLCRLPIIKVTGREIRVGKERYRFGIVRFAKDPARMKNVWRSSAAQWLGQAPKVQWLVQSADEEERKAIEKASRSGETVIGYTGQNPPQRQDPPTAPNALLQEAALADQDIKDATGLHNASLGMNSRETSGKAIKAREQQGDVATFMYHDNLHYSIKEGGRVINDMITIAFDTARTAVVMGEDGATTPTRINDPTADEHIDLKTGKYDVTLEVGPSYSTRRSEAADSMMEFQRTSPQVAALIADLIAEAQDWPMAETIAKRIRKTLPPGLADDEDGAPAPQGPPGPQGGAGGAAAAMAAQAQQMQLQAAQQAQQAQSQKLEMELAEQAAKTEQAQAQANKAKSDARTAEIAARRAELEFNMAARAAAAPTDPPRVRQFSDLTPEERAAVMEDAER